MRVRASGADEEPAGHLRGRLEVDEMADKMEQEAVLDWNKFTVHVVIPGDARMEAEMYPLPGEAQWPQPQRRVEAEERRAKAA